MINITLYIGTKGATSEEVVKTLSIQTSQKTITDQDSKYNQVVTDQEVVDKEWTTKRILMESYLKDTETAPPISIDEKSAKEDAAKTFRTKILLGWIFSNLVLVCAFTNELSLKYLFPRHKDKVNPYLTFLFWSVTFLSLVRAIGSTIYMYQYYQEKKQDRLAAAASRSIV